MAYVDRSLFAGVGLANRITWLSLPQVKQVFSVHGHPS